MTSPNQIPTSTRAEKDRERRRSAGWEYAYSAAGVGAATGILWLMRAGGHLDKGQASLLYLPVVIACSVWFGFGPAVLGALLSFLCWDFFFLPPYYTFIVNDPEDWLSLAVFLLAAITTARLASQSGRRAAEARAREAEITMLYRASETVSREVAEDRMLSVLAGQVLETCFATLCVIYRREPTGDLHDIVTARDGSAYAFDPELARKVAGEALKFDQVVGFDDRDGLWSKALSQLGATTDGASEIGAYIPLRAQDRLVGVLHVGPRRNGDRYTAAERRVVYTLANHAAVVIARQSLAARAAQAEALREADALKEALLSLVSHELRTPLAAIKASASGLLQTDAVWDDQERHDALARIDQEADRLTQVVSNLLDLSRLEAGAWEPNCDWCDTTEIVSTVLDRFTPEETERIRVHMDDTVPMVQVDYIQIALLLTNLVQNALKYTPPDSPIDLTLGVSGNLFEVSVRDAGRGIEPGEEDLLFTRFYRGKAHRKGTIHGTGLGLALCAAIARAHGGDIGVVNAPSDQPSGAIFSFAVPLERAA